MRPWKALAGLMLALVAGSAGAVSQDPGGVVMDGWTTTLVTSGRNTGEIWMIKNIVGHHWLNHPNLSNTTFSVTQQRTHDAEGVALNDERRTPNYQSLLVPSTHKEGPPNGTGCLEHEWKGWHMGSNGEFDWEASLGGRGAEAGTYKITIEWRDGIKKELTRGWLIGKVQPVRFHCTDQYGNPAVALDVNQLEPIPAPLDPTDEFGFSYNEMSPGLYEIKFSHPEFENYYHEFLIPNVTDDNPPLLEISIPMKRIAATSNKTGQVNIKVRNADGSLPEGWAWGTISLARDGTTKEQNVTQTSGYDCAFTGLAPGKYRATLTTGSVFKSPQTFEVDAVAAIARDYTLKPVLLGGEGPPTVEEPNESTNPGFWESLLVPKESTLDDWKELINQMTSWGPFGVVKQLFTSWEGAARTGENTLKWESTWQPAGNGGPTVGGVIDLRPRLAGGGLYPDGGAGSVGGDLIKHLRTILGWLVWIGFVFALGKWIRPRVSW